MRHRTCRARPRRQHVGHGDVDVLALAGVPDPDGQVNAFIAAIARHAPGVGELALSFAGAQPATDMDYLARAYRTQGLPR